ncbi:SGNH/GDSL hydrolase family protein [Hymenobacter cellulosilyticus]|uniref:SGNH/GDSL hydrolase family protein n=1 Tax=Hymenobacter cellulosilyticus TaxID=2932248 RepID=A0A8T9QBX7_9BACT|nr:SGNH/GDSL hydrolase family protein [Hymenobacter cellulosilyticus]UOQ73628.1 SGNH/GDSL hydrolase family protein [Hymenobacter cellulosilyticus]
MNTTLFRKFVPFVALLGLGLTACQPDLEDDFKASAGTADFTRYIAVGNSLTAGFSDNGLYLEGQQNSYPNLLAMQFKAVGGGDFEQPLFESNQSNGSGYLTITGFDSSGNPIIGNVAANAAVGLGADKKTPLLAKYTGTGNQNLGVPGIRVADITTVGYGFNNPQGFNPYFERLLNNSPATYLQYVQERVNTIKPTFFTNWLGNNDVLGYATSGGAGTPLTTAAEFSTKYRQMLDVLTSGGAKGVVATIPPVTNVPLFTTVPVTAIIAGIKANKDIPNASNASLYIRTGTNTVREATANDLLLLPARAVIGTKDPLNPLPVGVGYSATSANPLPSQFVLDATEITNVNNRTADLNKVITDEANARGLAVFDANAYFAMVARNGVITNGISNSAAFVSGNLFSLDGVHPTPRGYALIANEMIKTINAKYGASVPQVNAAAYRGVEFP